MAARIGELVLNRPSARQRKLRPAMSFRVVVAAVLLLVGTVRAEARVTRIEIARTEPACGGVAFGDVGAYEMLIGTAYGEVDPVDAHNAVIQDIGLAPRNAHGKVEYSMDVIIQKPVDMARGNGTLLHDVVNRG